MSDYYRVLGVSKGADLCEIRRAYWALARRLQADRDKAFGGERLRNVRRAYYTLGDSSRRHTCDAQRPYALDGQGVRQTRQISAFSDDVALDFPSMAELVGRIYAAFFGADGDPATATQTAQVELTPREADDGAEVPIALEMSHTCPVCGGRGEMWLETCGVCSGTGCGRLPHQLQLRVPPGVRHGTRLRFSFNPPYAAETQVEVRIAIQ